MRPDSDEVIIIGGGKQDMDPEVLRKQMRMGCGCLGVVALLVLLLGFVVPYTDYLWFTHDARHPEVFTTAYVTKGTLFIATFLPILLLMYFSFSKALQVGMVFIKMPSTRGEVLVSNALGLVQRLGPSVTKLAALLLSIFFAVGFQGEWNTWLLFSNSQRFGVSDPTFGLDLSFFVFALPWWLAVANLVFGVLLLTTVLTIGIYVGLQVLAALAKIELSRPFIRMHICALVGLTVIAYALQVWLRRYEVGLVETAQFTGAGHAGIQALGAKTILSYLIAALGIGIIVNGRVGSPFRFTTIGGAAVAVLYILGVVAYPAGVQAWAVEPNKLDYEGPYASQAIKMTRFGYDLDRIEVKDQAVAARPTAQEIEASRETLENMRLWDPEVLRQSLNGIQALKGYYTFHDVDLDRYDINGKQTMVMLSPRDVDLDGLQPNSRTWVNMRLSYTHGFGVAMVPVNQVGATGQPAFIIRDVPPKAPEDIPLQQPRIYFSDFRNDGGQTEDQYALVSSGTAEFDYPGTNDEKNTYRWTGNRGVPMGSFFTRLAYSIALKDGKLLLSESITGNTKLLYRRNVIERANLIYPFLRFDRDPYVVLVNGKMLWVLDGYTSSGRIPYSRRLMVDRERINYIRNSVKVVVDAYSGETTAYAMLPNEPILKAYRSIYPRLVKNADQMPEGLTEHLRYPEDMFNLQAMQLTEFHVTDPTAFLQNQDAWDIAYEQGLSGAREEIRPYYVQMKLPDEAEARFMLILPFTPRQRPNMSGWLAAHCDPESYGKLVLYRYQGQSLENIAAPQQMESKFNTDPKIADINRQLNNEQSELIAGNLLVIPIGKSVMYAEPLFLKSRTGKPIPELKKVILAFSDKIVVGDTYEDALAQLLEGQAEVPPTIQEGEVTPPTQGEQPPAGQTVPKAQLREALRLLDQAEQALRSGDFAKYGQLQKQARERLRKLAAEGGR